MAEKISKGIPGERIAKVIARAGLASRREAEAWIAAGRVSVNGAVISSPALNVTPSDRIAVDGSPLRARERTRLFLYHKPRGLVTTHSDPEGRDTIFRALPKGLPRLFSTVRTAAASGARCSTDPAPVRLSHPPAARSKNFMTWLSITGQSQGTWATIAEIALPVSTVRRSGVDGFSFTL